MLRAVVLLLIALLASWPNLTLQDWRGTEGRRVQIATEMLQSHDWFVPTLGFEPTYAKPPLHYWILACVQEWFGGGFVAMRLPSVLGFWLLALLAFALLRRMFSHGAAWVGALGILLSPILLEQSASAEIDPLFAAFTAGSLACLAHGVAREGRGLVFLAGVLGGLAMLQKGPPYLFFAAGAWLVWLRHRRLRFWPLYFAPLLLLPLAYYAPLMLLRVNLVELAAVAGDESLGRVLRVGWREVAITPIFWAKAILMLLPFCLWSTWEFRGSRDARMGPQDFAMRMCTAAVVFAILLQTFSSLRATRYLLPNVPLFVFAVAPAVAHFAEQQRELGRFARAGLRLVGALGAFTLIVCPFLPLPFPGGVPALALSVALLPTFLRTPRQLVACCFWLPLLASWTGFADRAQLWPLSSRCRVRAGDLLRDELTARDASDLQTFGHMQAGVLLGAGVLPRGDEAAIRPPTSRWVLHESEREPPLPLLPQYTPRLRLAIPDLVFVLEERRENGR